MKLLLPVGSIAPLLIAALASIAAAQQEHVEASLGWSKQPISNPVLDDRIRDAASQYQAYAPIPRVAFYDIAYPKDSAEASALAGYAVMVVTALVQDSTELPLSSLYLHTAAGDRPIDPLSAIASDVSDPVIRGTFGRFRLDALYLLPLSRRLEPGDLLADFATHRKRFRLGQFDGQAPDQVRQLGTIREPTQLPPSAAVAAIVHREYPDLAPLFLGAP
jgi:hypothetical protein